MLPRLTLCALVFALIGLPARAQIVSVYALSANDHFSNVPTGYTSSSSAEQYTSYWSSGIGGGVTFNFLPVGPVRLGIDFRGSTKTGTPGADTGMAGLRLGLHIPLVKIKPFIQASAGYVGTRTVNVTTNTGTTVPVGGTFTNQYAAYEIIGGIDYPLIHFVDFRVIEIGGGQGYLVGGLSIAAQTIPIFTVDTGLVVHF